MLTLRGRAAWAHDEGNNRNVSVMFDSLPGSNLTINGAVPSKDLALLSADADLAWMNNVTLLGMFEGSSLTPRPTTAARAQCVTCGDAAAFRPWDSGFVTISPFVL
jgi:hypothetical protein